MALVLVVTTRMVPSTVSAARSLRDELRGDRAAALLAVAVRRLPPGFEAWGCAMQAELAHIGGRGAKWRFAAGCAWAAILIRSRTTITRPAPGAAATRGIVATGIVAALALSAYGLATYPDLRTSANVWPAIAVFLVVLLAYAVAALVLSSSGKTNAHPGLVRRYGVVGGLVVGCAWILILSPTPLLKDWVAAPLAVAMLGPVVIGALAGRATRDTRAARSAAFLSGIVGGLAVFAVWVTLTYLRHGRPYDAGLVHDFHRSGAPNLAAYAVSDNFGSGLLLLVLVPTMAVALDSLSASFAARATGRRARL